MTIHDEIILALAQLDQARQNFNYATPNFINMRGGMTWWHFSAKKT